jgi:hypothetical protein
LGDALTSNVQVVTDRPARSAAVVVDPASHGAPPALPTAPERCSGTGLTKPECHCRACLAALVERHAPSPA